MNVEINSIFYIHDIDNLKYRIARTLPFLGLLKGDELVYEGTTKHWRHKEAVQFRVSGKASQVNKAKRTLSDRFCKLQLKAKTVSHEEESSIQSQIRSIAGLFATSEPDYVNIIDALDDLESNIRGDFESKPAQNHPVPIKNPVKRSPKKISFSEETYTFRRSKFNRVFDYLHQIGELEDPLVIPPSHTNFDEYEEKLEFDFALVFERLKMGFKTRSSNNLNLLSHHIIKKDILSYCHVLVKEAQK